MNRRYFLRTLSSGLVLAVPSTVFFLPPRGGWPKEDYSHSFAFYVDGFRITDVDWMLKECWDAYRVQPDALYVTETGILLHEEFRRVNSL